MERLCSGLEEAHPDLSSRARVRMPFAFFFHSSLILDFRFPGCLPFFSHTHDIPDIPICPRVLSFLENPAKRQRSVKNWGSRRNGAATFPETGVFAPPSPLYNSG